MTTQTRKTSPSAAKKAAAAARQAVPTSAPALRDSKGARSAAQGIERLRKLSQADLAKLEDYERQGQGRRTVLERIHALRAEPPWSGYDDLEVEDVNAALKRRDGDAAGRVLDYESKHKARKTIIDFAQRRQDGSATQANGSQRKGRARSQASSQSTARSAKSGSTPRAKAGSRKASSGKASSGAERRATAAKPAPRSTANGRAKASPSATRRKSSARKASASSKTRASRSRPQARTSAPGRVKTQMTGAVRGAGARTEKAARQTARAVGGAAGDAGHAVGGAAKRAKGPALATGVVVAALGGGIALGRGSTPKPRRHKRVLGVPVPPRTAFGKAAKQVSRAADGAGSAGRQVAQWSDGFRDLRQIVADARLADTKPGTAKLVARAVAKRALS